MQQMNLEGLNVVELNYESADLPKPVRDFKPQVYQDGDSFCCLLGPDPQAGIFGCGPSPTAAMEDWVGHFNDRIKHPSPDDPIATEICDYLTTNKKDVW
ncbi:hypothetical protein L3C95_17100 [Chitinophaga filiformis]|uniref:hypothetical protein n=1 Tax=Chitinophaga filiformis TaxID=104663 RepID=UPI001F31C52E|nr:hypothetical protein [Chitinophaga filiformis]MCF6404617.1 hypothetical protein [Chitinophaga filiformis]